MAYTSRVTILLLAVLCLWGTSVFSLTNEEEAGLLGLANLWPQQGWLRLNISNACDDPRFLGITCTPFGHIYVVSPVVSINGTLDMALSYLSMMPFLYQIGFVHIGASSTSELTGTIPPKLLMLPSLRHITISGHRLQGTIPSVVNDDLHSLLLDRNHLNGTIPQSLVASKSLVKLVLSGNELQGTLPEQFGPFLRYLDVSRNSLHGTIPNSIGNIVRGLASYLDLSRNMLTGSIPSMFEAPTAHDATIILHGNSLDLCSYQPILSSSYPTNFSGGCNISPQSFSGSDCHCTHLYPISCKADFPTGCKTCLPSTNHPTDPFECGTFDGSWYTLNRIQTSPPSVYTFPSADFSNPVKILNNLIIANGTFVKLQGLDATMMVRGRVEIQTNVTFEITPTYAELSQLRSIYYKFAILSATSISIHQTPQFRINADPCYHISFESPNQVGNDYMVTVRAEPSCVQHPPSNPLWIIPAVLVSVFVVITVTSVVVYFLYKRYKEQVASEDDYAVDPSWQSSYAYSTSGSVDSTEQQQLLSRHQQRDNFVE